MPKLVSVILPTKMQNVNLLMDSLSTVIYQSYQSWEVIVLKPESFDFDAICGMVYANVKDKFRFVDVPEDLSIGEIRNIGIEHSRGSYITYLDDDDLWAKDYLKTQVEELEKSFADLVYCNYHLRIQAFNNRENKYIQHFISIPYNVNPFNRDILLTEPFIRLSCVLHTKEVTEIIKFPDLTSYEDWLFLINVSKIFKFHSLHQSMATVQKRLDYTNNKTRLGNESIRNLKFILKETENQIQDETTKKIRDMIFAEFEKEYSNFFNQELNQLDILLQHRGIDYAFGYLKYLLISGIIDSKICKKGFSIAQPINKELANDLLFLADWYEGNNLEEYNNYTPAHFVRKENKWNVSL